MEYTLDSPVGELFLVSPDVDAPLAVGASVSVTLAAHGVVVIPPAAPTAGPRESAGDKRRRESA